MVEPAVSAFDAVVLRDLEYWQRNTVKLAVRQRQGDRYAYLMRDGNWKTAEEGTSPDDAGLELPAGAIEAIAEAIAAYQGDAGHAATEARVLREWLAAERARVDAVLAR